MTRHTGVAKQMNSYANELGGMLYGDAPKAVLAAIAVSALTCGGDLLAEAKERLLREWWILFDNGIVPQKPTFPRPPALALAAE